jgi:phosphoglycerate dehydrogenase-like enzyme
MLHMDEILVLITVNFREEMLERIRALSPRINVVLHPSETLEEFPQDILPEVEILYTSIVLPDPEDVPKLKWVQSDYAGIDHIAGHAIVNSDVKVTTLSGVTASVISEYVLMSVLSLGHKLPLMMADKAENVWAEEGWRRFRPLELRGSTVGIVGYGSIGRQIAHACKAMGADILVVKRDLKNLKDEGFRIEGTGDPDAELADRIYPPQAIGSMSELCDFLIITLPLTKETRGLIDEKVFHKMQEGSYLIDVSRGGVVDHGALVEALNDGRLAGAALDVYPVEPLPSSSPLWEMENVILSPHISGSTVRYRELALDLFVENMQRYLSEQPLLNEFNLERGY